MAADPKMLTAVEAGYRFLEQSRLTVPRLTQHARDRRTFAALLRDLGEHVQLGRRGL